MFRKRGPILDQLKHVLNMMVDARNQPITVCRISPVCIVCNDEGRTMVQSTFNRFFDDNFVYE